MVIFVTALAHYHIILGLPWLEKHDPQTRWAARTITFSSPYYRDNYNVSEHPQHQPMLRQLPAKGPPKYLPERLNSLKKIDITLVSIIACQSYNKKDYNMFVASIEDIDGILDSTRNSSTIRVNSVRVSDEIEPEIIQQLPEEI